MYKAFIIKCTIVFLFFLLFFSLIIKLSDNIFDIKKIRSKIKIELNKAITRDKIINNKEDAELLKIFLKKLRHELDL
jgi:hypothetical protein